SAAATKTVNVTAVNDAPTLTLPGPAVSYNEGAPAVLLDVGATAADVDSADFDTGTLTVSLSANGSAGDRLGINSEGTGAGQVGVSGSTITFGGTAIGAFTGGTDTTPLVITFNASATPAVAQAVLRN